MSNKYLFISPHCDDETLFGAYTLQAKKPIVAFVDHTSERQREAKFALAILGCKEYIFLKDINELKGFEGTVYAPALEGGHPLHDFCHNFAKENFTDVIYYSTYRSGSDLQPMGRFKVEASPLMEIKKLEALEAYKSQIEATPWHFQLTNKDEYYA